MTKFKVKNPNVKTLVSLFVLCVLASLSHLCFGIGRLAFSQEEFTYDSKGRRNPFIPLVSSDGRLLKLDKEEKSESSDLLLEGIIYDKQGRSFAVVNGSVVGVSDTIAGYQVLKIEDKKVTFIKGAEIREIGMTKEGK